MGPPMARAIPAYHDYTVRAKLTTVVIESQSARDALAKYYESSRAVPDTLSITWTCTNGDRLKPQQLPFSCRN
jgi:hypothetical protein